MLTEKQRLLFEKLKQIKDTYVDISVGSFHPQSNTKWWADSGEAYKLLRNKLSSEEDLEAITVIQNELVKTVIYHIMEMIDGYGGLSFEVDLIDKETKQSLRDGIEFHDKFMDYLYENEEDNKK
ncbi:histidine kinase [Paenibacillus sp. V4I5]|uniref:histidine kinase n=1 Tax=Paenibacillus sp. V4I5 TaxID=3042306 RepID=UPI0027907364|nr:histidine kinase [Paenibacillus sp. V4I5]MDQ0914554.1 hypothetical protein [Paenibacillus sp. V4I5]